MRGIPARDAGARSLVVLKSTSSVVSLQLYLEFGVNGGTWAFGYIRVLALNQSVFPFRFTTHHKTVFATDSKYRKHSSLQH